MKNKLQFPHIHLFRVCGGYYIYDVCKNVILKITEDLYLGLNNYLKYGKQPDANCMYGMEKLENEGYLQPKTLERIEHPMTNALENIIDNSLHMLTLQVTQNCNLRCKYCVYSGSYINRKHTNKRMSFEIAKKAIDYYISRSIQMSKLRFGFYGGEPILEIELIRKCVSYIKERALGKIVEYNLTTNATILNEEIIQFLVENNFFLTISLDGAKDIQDKNRIYAGTGNGTFDDVIRNVTWLKKHYPDYIKNIHFNVVMDPEDGYSSSNEFFMNDERVKDIFITASEKNDVNYKKTIVRKPEYYINRSYEQFKTIFDYYRNIEEAVSPLTASYLVGIKKNVVDTLVMDNSGFTVSHPGGPCVPGLQRLFVNADGNFYPCERVNESSDIVRIGDVENGIDIEKAKYLLNIGKITEEHCKRCWAFRFCTACAAQAEDGEKLSAEKRIARCNAIRSSIEASFKEYCILKELKLNFDELEEETH